MSAKLVSVFVVGKLAPDKDTHAELEVTPASINRDVYMAEPWVAVVSYVVHQGVHWGIICIRDRMARCRGLPWFWETADGGGVDPRGFIGEEVSDVLE